MSQQPQISHAEDNKRIAKNTLMLYGRMLFSMAVSLYTSRLVLNTLGVEDYGIYNVVGGFVAMFSLISGSLSSSVSRFITFELGKGDTDKLKQIFSTSILIHLALALIVFVLAETVGIWFLYNKMTIPAERLTAAMWVFQASVLNFAFSLWSVPYNATIIAHEHMKAFAWIGIFDVVMRLLIVLFIAFSPWVFDRLIVYAILLTTLALAMRVIYARYCHRHFEESHWSFCFDKQYWKELGSFAGWNFIGSSSAVLKDQGVNILINLFFGPVLNAARGIATTVNGAICGFVNNFMVALNPQITKSYASGDYPFLFSLIERGARFSFYIILVLALPVLFETDFVLALWLKQYPEHTVNFVRLIILLSMCEMVSNPLVTLQLATGKIRNYQIAVGSMLMMNFPLSYICLAAGMPPESTLVVAIAISLCCLLLRLIFLRKMVPGFSARGYFRRVCLKVATVTACAAILPYLIHQQMDYGWFRVIMVGVSCIICCSTTILCIGCTPIERQYIIHKLQGIRQKLAL